MSANDPTIIVLDESRKAMLGPSVSANADGGRLKRLLLERYRGMESLSEVQVTGPLSDEPGYFRFGEDVICYGRCASAAPATSVTGPLHQARQHVEIDGSSVHLPFDPAEVLDNLRCERYCDSSRGIKTLPASSVFRGLYYFVRPVLRVSVRKHFQKLYFRGWDKIAFPQWPVDRTVESLFEQLLVLTMQSRHLKRVPFVWFWPDRARSCTMMTHDVETTAGRDFCSELMDVNDTFGIKSAFQIVPEDRYLVPQGFLDNIRGRGFEINVHDLNHDGRLMNNREEFLRRAQRINSYAKEFGAKGFRSAVMYRNVDWYDALEFSYDMSVPNVAHLDPQQGGCCTVLPFFLGKILELPLTTTQDYSLFNILKEYSIRLWKEQVSLIREKHGLISFITHPDYLIDLRARKVYADLLRYLSDLRSQGETWIALPSEVAAWWRIRSGLSLVGAGNAWRIEGNGSDRATLAYAVLENDKLTYEFDGNCPERADLAG
jgi:hypothetical protein